MNIARFLRTRLHALRAVQAASPRRRRGMTLMEVMIVIAIILLVMGALSFGVLGMFEDARGDTARLQINRINERVKIYQIKKKKVPASLADVYTNEPEPTDPWGKPFVLRPGGAKGYDIVSLGGDGKEGGTGTDADIKLSEMD
jgi:general secretion pathway protein G